MQEEGGDGRDGGEEGPWEVSGEWSPVFLSGNVQAHRVTGSLRKTVLRLPHGRNDA